MLVEFPDASVSFLNLLVSSGRPPEIAGGRLQRFAFARVIKRSCCRSDCRFFFQFSLLSACGSAAAGAMPPARLLPPPSEDAQQGEDEEPALPPRWEGSAASPSSSPSSSLPLSFSPHPASGSSCPPQPSSSVPSSPARLRDPPAAALPAPALGSPGPPPWAGAAPASTAISPRGSPLSAPFTPPPLPASFSFSPLPLHLSDKRVPQALSATIAPSAYVTNIWTSICVCATGFSARDLFLIARSLPNSEYSGGSSLPVVLRLKSPSCTAVLSANGRLSIMGGVTREQAAWQAYRVAYKLKFRMRWRFGHGASLARGQAAEEEEKRQEEAEKQRLLSGERLAAAAPLASSASSDAACALSYVSDPRIRFVPEEIETQQMVCRLDLGGAFRPDLERLESHPSLQGRVVGIKDGLTIRVPLPAFEAAAPLAAASSDSAALTAAGAEREDAPPRDRCRGDGASSAEGDRRPCRRLHAIGTPEGEAPGAAAREKRQAPAAAALVWKEKNVWSGGDDGEDEDPIAAELFAGLEGSEDSASSAPSSPQGRGGELASKKRRKRGRAFADERRDGRGALPKKKGATCIVYRSGRLLVLGCTSAEEIDYAVSFVWPALVGL
ncbi:hypothetical protein BESB_036770 [Besnoitia besnoiti]|uniref:Uncharacterized protein n=1 Tax=Besnoitia besnoiti TaxID=94643 RepID=A0A2A9MH39_BESBE|nr:hypothetical protein BESB_036770 [Besnoitia besnoiti]PFH37219.1 hypothetical protein BESB_036770 [Besnoitia besnoiti]